MTKRFRVNQLRRIHGAVKRIVPTLAQVKRRRPRGFTPQEHESLQIHLQTALEHLNVSAAMFDVDTPPAPAGGAR